MNQRGAHNPFGGASMSVDKRLGNSFPIVEAVYRQLQHIKYLAENLNELRPKDIELQENVANKTLDWRYIEKDGTKGPWQVLVPLIDITGQSPEMRVSADAKIQWKYTNEPDSAWRNIFDLSGYLDQIGKNTTDIAGIKTRLDEFNSLTGSTKIGFKSDYPEWNTTTVKAALDSVFLFIRTARGKTLYLTDYLRGVTGDLGPKIQQFIDDVCTQGVVGEIDPGTYKSGIPLVVDFGKNAQKGATFRGAGLNNTILDLRGSGGGLTIKASTTPEFYPTMVDIGVFSDAAGPTINIGSYDLSDEINEGLFRLLANNYRNNEDAVGVSINGVYNSVLFLVSNCAGKGSSALIRQAQFCTFGGSFGWGTTAMRFIDGYSYGNAFNAIDWEVCSVCVTFEVATAFRNTFVGGQLVWDNGQSPAIAAINATAGNNNRFINANFGTNGKWALSAVGLIVDNSGIGSYRFGEVLVSPEVGDAVLAIDAPLTGLPSIQFRKDGKTRWAWVHDTSGNMILKRYDLATGAFLDDVLYGDQLGNTVVPKAALQKVGFFGKAPANTAPVITGSRSDPTAFTSLLNELVKLGLVVDNTTA